MERMRRLKSIIDVQARMRDRALAAGVRAQAAIETLQERERVLLETLDIGMLPALLVPLAIARLSRSAAERDTLRAQMDVTRRSALQHGRFVKAGERLMDRLHDEHADLERRRALEELLIPDASRQFRESGER